jgi:hypothetical protein
MAMMICRVWCAHRRVLRAGQWRGSGGRQLVNAGLVVAVGKEMGLPRRAWVGGGVATAAAMAESHLTVLANTTVPESLALPHEGHCQLVRSDERWRSFSTWLRRGGRVLSGSSG